MDACSEPVTVYFGSNAMLCHGDGHEQMATGSFDGLWIDQLSPFTFEGVLFLVVDGGNVDAKDADGFRVGECADDLSRVMNLNRRHANNGWNTTKGVITRKKITFSSICDAGSVKSNVKN